MSHIYSLAHVYICEGHLVGVHLPAFVESNGICASVGILYLKLCRRRNVVAIKPRAACIAKMSHSPAGSNGHFHKVVLKEHIRHVIGLKSNSVLVAGVSGSKNVISNSLTVDAEAVNTDSCCMKHSLFNSPTKLQPPLKADSGKPRICFCAHKSC